MTGPHAQQQIDELTRQIEYLHRRGQFREALEQARQGWAFARRALGEEHQSAVRIRSWLGGLLQEMGDLEGARPHIEGVLANSRRVWGNDHPHVATGLNNLGTLLQGLGDLAAARTHLEEALAIRRRALGDSHPDVARSLVNLGRLLRAQGELAGARACLEEAVAIHRRVLGDDHPDTAKSVNSLGLLLRAIGDLAAARPCLEQAVAIQRRALGNDHPETAKSLDNLGGLLRESGEFEEARRCIEEAVAIFRRTLGTNHLDTATALNNLALLLWAMGGGRDNLAAARWSLEDAVAVFRRVLGTDHPLTALGLNNLGGLALALGDRGAARPHFEQALAIRERVLGHDHPETAQSLHNLAVLEVISGRIDAAVALTERAAASDDRMIGQVFAGGSDQQRLLFLRKLRANLAGFLSAAWRHGADSPAAVRLAFDLVLRRKALGAEALAVQRDAILGGRHPHLRAAFDELTRLRQRIAQKVLAGPAAGEPLSAHEQTLDRWRQEQERREAALAQELPELGLEQQFRKADRRAVALALPAGVALVEFVRFDVFDFDAVPARGDPQWQPARYLAFVLPAGEPEQVRMIDLGEASPIDQMIADFRAVITTPPWDRPAPAQKAPSPSAGSMWGWLSGLWKRGERGQKPHAEDEESAAAPGSPPRADLPAVATELRQRVFDPLLPALGEHTQLWLSPDGDLARLPFEVLPARERGRLLLDVYRISYLATGRDALRCGQPALRQPGPPVVVADPDFDLSPTPASAGKTEPPRRSQDAGQLQPVARLPGTRLEGERLAGLLGVRPVLDSAALDQPLKAIRSPRILHLATHGFFLDDQQLDPAAPWGHPGVPDLVVRTGFENPLLRSGLLLAGFNGWLGQGRPATPPAPAEDGMLTAEDVTSMDLLDTELAVLSACETGLGQIHVGEGVFGLRRAFAVAGARTLVMSLWRVPDQQTQELMVDFYQRVLKGEARAEALRQAQQAVRTRHADPYYWGAFICQGDPGPLRD
jgi:CHAT domain-containing protein/tetratricopeptide (TPR) repeat protein